MKKNIKKTNKIKKKNSVFKDVICSMKDNTFEFFRNLKKEPKNTLLSLVNSVAEGVKNNPVFVTYIVVNVFIGILLRFFTINTIDNLLLVKPILGDMAIVIILGSFNFALKEKRRFPYLLILSIIFTTFCVANSIYYTFYTSFISVSLIATSRYAVQVGDAIVENVLQAKDFIYLLSPVLLIIIYNLTKNKNNKKEVATKVKSKSIGKENEGIRKMIKSLIGGFIVLIVFICSLTSLEIGRYAKQWNREYIVMRFGVYAYQANDIVKSIVPKLTSIFGYDKAKKTFDEYYKDRSDTQDWENEYTSIFKGKNILVIHYESMQNLNMALSFNGEELTPNLNRIAKDSIYFDNFYSQVSVGTSSDTEFTFNTSLMPTNTGTAFVSYFNREYVATPKLLKDMGYYTFSMHANNGSYWNRNIMHESLGYERFYSKTDYEVLPENIIGLGLSDKEFLNQSVDKLKEIHDSGKKFYGTVITLTNHTPFDDLDKYGDYSVSIKEKVKNPETGVMEEVEYPYMEGTKLGNYFKSVHYADEALGEFFDRLEAEGILDDTVLVLYGDHDARLPKADYRRLYNYDKENDSTIDCDETDPNCTVINGNTYELLRRVPFLIYSKETKAKLHTTVSNVMGMYDCMPTLGNMFGFYNKYALGHDIFDAKDNNIVVFPNGNWVTNYIYYNNQNNTYLTLKETELPVDYINNNTKYTEDLLSASNSTVVYDLIKHARQTKDSKEEYIEENIKDLYEK